MQPEIQTLCLQYIADEWRKLQPLNPRDEPSISPPWGVWIQLYGPIPINQNNLYYKKDTLLKVWFLTKRGLEERNPWEYIRFIVVNWERPWSIMFAQPRVAIWGKFHEIALAAFAECIEEDKICSRAKVTRVTYLVVTGASGLSNLEVASETV